MISVVIPLYNKENRIENTLQSVFNQTFQDFEIVIVNDGSTDKSVERVKKWDDDRIRLIEQENQGVSAARNRGIAESSYDLIAFLDADDEWKPEYLQAQYELFCKYPQCSVFACNYELKNTNGQIKPTIIRKLPFAGTDGILTNYFEAASCSHPPICSISIMVKKEAILSVGGFPAGVKSGEDLLTWARLAVEYKIAYNKTSLASFVLEISSAPRRTPSKEDIVGSELKKLYQKNPPVPGLKTYISLWHKMRASVFMRLSDRKNALKEILIALKYNICNLKLYIYLLLVFLPKALQNKILLSGIK